MCHSSWYYFSIPPVSTKLFHHSHFLIELSSVSWLLFPFPYSNNHTTMWSNFIKCFIREIGMVLLFAYRYSHTLHKRIHGMVNPKSLRCRKNLEYWPNRTFSAFISGYLSLSWLLICTWLYLSFHSRLKKA